MQCPNCGSDSKVTDLSYNKADNERYRCRTCKECGHIFYTTEFVVECDDAFMKMWWENHRSVGRDRRKKHD